MAAKYFCDRCDGRLGSPSRVSFYFDVSQPHDHAAQPRYAKDLCPGCFDHLKNAIDAALAKLPVLAEEARD